MRAIITPSTPGIAEDLIERLMESQAEVVALVRRTEHPDGQKQHIDVAIYGTDMLAPAELRRRMEGCEIVYQDIYSFANLEPRPDDDDVVRAAWAGGQPTRFAKQRPGAIIEDVYTTPDAIIKVHLWSSSPAPARGARRELPQPLVQDRTLLPHLDRSTLKVTLLVPPRISPMEEGLVLTGREPVDLVFAELLDYWAGLSEWQARTKPGRGQRAASHS